jgi:hypothetical protein
MVIYNNVVGLHVMCPLTLTLTWVTNFVEPITIYNPRLNLNGTCIHPSKGSYFHLFPNDLQQEKKRCNVLFESEFYNIIQKIMCPCLGILHLNKCKV